MKVIVACDSFKNALSAPKVCSAFARGLLSGNENLSIVEMPLADGGEGTADAIISATHATAKEFTVPGPLGKNVTSRVGILPGFKGVMDMASASGIQLISKNALNPYKASTFGSGVLFAKLVAEGCKEIILGLGGSATVDGGVGFLKALGVKFYDSNDNEIADGPEGLLNLVRIDTMQAQSILDSTKVIIASDVTNPLLGPKGAATVFGPQKNVKIEEIPLFENALSVLQNVVIKQGFVTDSQAPGDGAAGGLGFALRAFFKNSQVSSGASLVMTTCGFFNEINNADLVITGEGKTDSQTQNGKLCSIVAKTSKAYGVPVVLASGAFDDGNGSLFESFSAVFSISQGPCSLEDAIMNTEENCFSTGKSIARLLLVN